MPFWRPRPVPSELTARDERRQPVIVVADDDRDTRELYRAFFDLNGFRTAEAATGNEAVLVSKRVIPDVLLTDLVLPDLDGLVVTQLLKGDPLTAGIRVLLVTGYAFAGLDRRVAAAGIERALVKPCLPQVMLREVLRALSRPASASARSEDPAPDRHVALRDQQDDRPRPVVDAKRQDF